MTGNLMEARTEPTFMLGHVSRLPSHTGDGYSYGGDLIVTFGDRSINLGTDFGADAIALAHLLAAAPRLLSNLEVAVKLLDSLPGFARPAQIENMQEALSKARGPSHDR